MSVLIKTYLRLKYRLLSLFAPGLAVKSAIGLFFTPRRHMPKPVEDTIKERATKGVLGSGVTYYRWGEGDVVVFIHGWEGRGTQVSAMLDTLTKNFQVIAIDAPAHGESGGVTSHPNLFVKSLFELVEKVGPVHAIVGHSMGGGSAVYAAATGIKTAKVVSIAGPSNFLDVVTAFANFIGLFGKAKNAFLDHVEDFVGIPFEPIASKLSGQKNPPSLLVLHDESDKEVPVEHAKAYLSGPTRATVSLSQGLGHRKILYAPETAQKVNEFLLN